MDIRESWFEARQHLTDGVGEEGSGNCRQSRSLFSSFSSHSTEILVSSGRSGAEERKKTGKKREELGIVDNYFLPRVSVSAVSSRMVFVRGYLSNDDWNVRFRASANRDRLIPPLSPFPFLNFPLFFGCTPNFIYIIITYKIIIYYFNKFLNKYELIYEKIFYKIIISNFSILLSLFSYLYSS